MKLEFSSLVKKGFCSVLILALLPVTAIAQEMYMDDGFMNQTDSSDPYENDALFSDEVIDTSTEVDNTTEYEPPENPAFYQSCGSDLYTPLESISLSLHGTGVEESGNWAIIATRSGDDILVNEGETFGECFFLTKVKNNSITIALPHSGATREFFLAGFSSRHIRDEQSPRSVLDGDLRAYEGYQLTLVAPNIVKVSYPKFSNNNTLPKIIFSNDRGTSLYEDFEALGLGEVSSPSEVSPAHEGVTIGKNSAESLFGSLGLQEGDRILAVNGRRVSSSEEISRALKNGDGRPIHIGYSDMGSDGILTTTALVTNRQ